VSVTIDNKPAAVYFISPTQLDVQVPDDANQGPVQVIVTNANGSSDPVAANLSTLAPSLFTVDGQHLAATHANNLMIGQSSPAKPGEVIVLYGTGFGPTNPAIPAGVVVSAPSPLLSPSDLTISIGGSVADIAYAGITEAGVWQFNIAVPLSVADGDAPVMASIKGLSTQSGTFLTIQH
jgi:uncharacterized protein (TIGR03437 family)